MKNLIKTYHQYQQVTPALNNISLKHAIYIANHFEDNPQGETENEIDSILIEYTMADLLTLAKTL